MGTMYHLHPGLDGETTAELLVSQDRLADARRLKKLLDQRRTGKPDPRYTRVMVIMGAVACLDWVAIAVHTTASKVQGPWLGVHQAVVATLTILAACSGIGWAVLHAVCRRDAERDEMDQIRHRELLAAVEQAVRAGEQREWMSYTSGLRDAAGQQAHRPEPDGSVMPMRHQRRPGR